MARLLVLSAGAGAGHNRAAEAVAAAAKEEGHEAHWLDALKYTSRVFNALYADAYIWMANHSPEVWGYFYKLLGKPAKQPVLERLVREYDSRSYRNFMEAVTDCRADAIVCTHFLPPNVVRAHLGRRAPPLYTVITDFDVHRYWVQKETDGYFVGNDQVRWLLGQFGFPADRIDVTGIPVHPAFSRARGRAEVRRELGLDPAAPTVLFMSGGFGMGDMAAATGQLLALDAPFQLLVVAGRNEKLRARLEKEVKGSRRRVRVFGFVDNVQDLMEASDLLISKSGGLTSCEAMARSLPMIVFSPIPGQEERNADYLIESGAALKAPAAPVLGFKVVEALQTPGRLGKMKAAAASIARPRAARDVVRRVLERL